VTTRLPKFEPTLENNDMSSISERYAALREQLGPHYAPEGLYEQNKALPFAGRVSCNVDRLETLAVGSEPVAFERIVGVPLRSYAAVSLNYFFGR